MWRLFGLTGPGAEGVVKILPPLKHLLLIVMVSILLAGGAAGQEELSEADLEVIEMLEFLEIVDLIEDSDFELIEGLTEMGDGDGS